MSYRILPTGIGGSALVRQYLRGEDPAAAFFAGDPYDIEAYREKLREVEGRFGREERQRAAAALHPTSDAARARLNRFVEEGGAVVTTGQQAGFLTGPLYTIYKAISAAVLARHLEERLGIVVLPVFWAATEDHDWAEANHAFLLDHRGRLHRFSLPEPADSIPLPMSRRQLGEGADEIVAEVRHMLIPEAYVSSHLTAILDAYGDPRATVGTAFLAAMRTILGRWDMLVADAASPDLKRASAPWLAQALTHAEEHQRLLQVRETALREAGFAPQVPILDRGVNLFLHGEEGRERLYRRGKDFIVRERPGVVERESLLRLLEEEPERLSPNVLFRPVIESAVFPTLAYVGGPGEINYFAQVTALFEGVGIRPPLIVPRFAGTIRDDSTDELLDRLGLAVENLVHPPEVLRDRIARSEVPPPVAKALADARAAWAGEFDKLIDAAGALDPTLPASLGAIRNRGLLLGGRAERKILRALKRQAMLPFEQLDRVLNTLRPQGQPQDRVLNVAPFLARHGDDLFDAMDVAIRESWRLPT